MNESRNDYCNHEWDSDYLVRLCLHCGEVRLFPTGDENPRVLWPGRGTKDDPLHLPKADKALIAGVAKRFDLHKSASITGIPMVILRAWGGAYCRKPREPRVEHVIKRGRPRKPREEAFIAKGVHVPPALVVILTRFDPGNCIVCGDSLIVDEDEKPHYIQTPGGKIWLCGVCAVGVPNLFKALSIPYQVIGGEKL